MFKAKLNKAGLPLKAELTSKTRVNMGSEREAAARNTELRQKSQTRDQQTFSIKKQKESILGFMSQVIPRAIIQFFHCSIKAAADSTGRGSACVLERLYNMWGIHWQSLL